MKPLMRRGALAVVGVAVAALLAGCSAHPGTAALVDGHEITQRDLDRARDELGPILADPTSTGVLNVILQARAFMKVGESYDIEVTDAQAREFLDAVVAGAGGTPPAWGEESIAVGRAQVALQSLEERGEEGLREAFETELADLDVTVNPRYGVHDGETGIVGALDLPWIVVPEAALEEPVAE